MIPVTGERVFSDMLLGSSSVQLPDPVLLEMN